MDYHKTYTKLYEEHCQTFEALAIKEIRKCKKNEFSYSTTKDEVNNILRNLLLEGEAELKKNKLQEARFNFYKMTTLHNPNSALDNTINISLFKYFSENIKSSSLTFPQSLNILSKYWAVDYIKTQLHDSKIFNESIFYDTNLKDFNLRTKPDPIKNLREYQNNQKSKYKLEQKFDLTNEDEIEIIKWKEKISNFNNDEKLILISIYINIKSTVQTPEILKLIMITGGVFDLTILQPNYKNKKFYKIATNGFDYYKSNQRETIRDLILKLTPFKMEKITKALKRHLQT
tara:strand:- start:28723 stop:29586 length:864 start_codon:yes stop_codon:yes gene_type:complete